MARPAALEPLVPLGPLYPVEPPRALVRLSPIPLRGAADNFVRMAIRDYGGVEGKTIVVDCRGHRVPKAEFADQFVRRLFEQGAEELQFVEALPRLMEMVREVAARIGKEDKISETTRTAFRGLIQEFSEGPLPSLS